jgi:hypothetical protein
MLRELGTSKKFFDSWRADCVASMTLVEVLPEGELYYYESPYSCDVWVVVGANSVMVAYPTFERDIAEIRRRVELWDRARKNGVEPPQFSEIGHPVYAATEDPQTKQLTVAWFHPGDWCGLVNHLPLRRDWNKLPRGWPDSYSDRISQLASERHQLPPK